MARSDPRRSVSLQTRLGIVALVFLTLVLFAAGLSALMIRSWNRNVELRGSARVLVLDVAELRAAYSDQETGVRGYQLGGTETFLAPYREGTVVANRLLVRIRDAVASQSDLVRQLDDVRDAADRWRTEVAEPTIADPENAPADDIGLARFDALRAELDELASDADARLSIYADRASTSRHSALGVLFATALTAIVGTALVTVLFRRWITRPLALIGDAARRLAEDDTATMPELDAVELQDVANAIRSLQSSLVRTRDEAVTAYDALEQSAVLALHVRAELADELGEMPDGWAIQSLLIPAEGLVAGDCFDVGLLDARRLYLVLIDVTGHGAQAALAALRTKSQLRAALRARRAPGAALQWVAGQHRQDGDDDLLTAIVVVVDVETGVLQYANAGHPSALVTDGIRHDELAPTGPLIGAFDAEWQTEQVVLAPGTMLFVHTDGVTDAVGEGRERFGEERMRLCITDTSPQATISRLRAAVDEFRTGPRADDVTAIALVRLPVDGTPDTGGTLPT